MIGQSQPFYPEFMNQIEGYLLVNNLTLSIHIVRCFDNIFNSTIKRDFEALFGFFMTFEDRKELIDKYKAGSLEKTFVLYSMNCELYTDTVLGETVKNICKTYLSKYLL